MNIATNDIFLILQDYFSDEEIFQIAEFSKERFFLNLDNEKKGIITQSVIKQHFCLKGAVPLRDFHKLRGEN